jgi:hypothetical protein
MSVLLPSPNEHPIITQDPNTNSQNCTIPASFLRHDFTICHPLSTAHKNCTGLKTKAVQERCGNLTGLAPAKTMFCMAQFYAPERERVIGPRAAMRPSIELREKAIAALCENLMNESLSATNR